MKEIYVILLSFFSISLIAQDIPKNVALGKKNPYAFITSALLDLQENAQRNLKEGITLATKRAMPIQGEYVNVEIVNGAVTDIEKKIDLEYLTKALNINITTSYKNRASAWVKINDLVEIGRRLPAGYSLQEVIIPGEDNQGPALMNSNSYNTASTGGNGIRIAIIDGGFDGLTEARNVEAAPTLGNTQFFNFTGSPIESSGSHGRLCVEIVFDHAPNARYYIIKVNSVSDMGAAIEACINNDVDVISHSLSRYNMGWGDNTGPACAAAAEASDHGILFFTSAGNRNGQHWQGNFVDSDDDNWHNWSGADEQNNFIVSADGEVQAYLQWNSVSTTDHYDLYLYESGTNSILASSTNTGQFESLSYSPSTTRNVYFAVHAKTNNPPAFELFNHDSGCTDLQYASSSGSTTSPSNSTAANVISVGALPRANYNQPAGTSGIIASYSSRGPTNSGNLAPEICAPTNTSTTSGDFGGTSCATPNAAGAAAAFWSGHPQLNANGVRQILFKKADLYKDWGANGADNIYGRGGLYLYNYHVNNRYILRSASNQGSSITLPYYSIVEVDNDVNVPSDRRMIYLDDTDLVGNNGNVFNNPMLYKSAKGTVIRSGNYNLREEETDAIVENEESTIDEEEQLSSNDLLLHTTVRYESDLFSVFPNPFANSTTIEYETNESEKIAISVFDINGKLVKVLVNEENHPIGAHQVEFDGSHLPAGVYFCRLTAGNEVKQIRLVIAR